jgi:hypothetical protein
MPRWPRIGNRWLATHVTAGISRALTNDRLERDDPASGAVPSVTGTSKKYNEVNSC